MVTTPQNHSIASESLAFLLLVIETVRGFERGVWHVHWLFPVPNATSEQHLYRLAHR